MIISFWMSQFLNVTKGRCHHRCHHNRHTHCLHRCHDYCHTINIFNGTPGTFQVQVQSDHKSCLKLCLKWNDFQDALNASIRELKDDTDITDVTLACDDQSIKAHKVILSACTPWIENFVKCLYQRKRNLKEPVAKFDIDPNVATVLCSKFFPSSLFQITTKKGTYIYIK